MTHYTNTWNIIAADIPLYIVRDIGDYANMNMVFIFGGILVSIFIWHDYRSGYVKQLFTTHAKKRDYMMSRVNLPRYFSPNFSASQEIKRIETLRVTGDGDRKTDPCPRPPTQNS